MNFGVERKGLPYLNLLYMLSGLHVVSGLSDPVMHLAFFVLHLHVILCSSIATQSYVMFFNFVLSDPGIQYETLT